MKKLLLIMLIAVFAANCQADLVGLWHLDGDTDDSSINNNDGTLIGGPDFVAGVFDEEIADALAKTKATAENMATAANKKDIVDADVPLDAESIEGLGDIEDLEGDEAAGIEQL